MLPGIGGIVGKGSGLILFYQIDSTGLASGALRKSVGLTVPSYSTLEVIAEAGTGGGYARSVFVRGAGGSPNPGDAVEISLSNASFDDGWAGWIVATCAVGSVATLFTRRSPSQATGGQTNLATGSTTSLLRVIINYIP